MSRSGLLLLAILLAACGDGNRPPSLGLLVDQQVVVGSTLRVPLIATDADGDRLTFRMDGLPKTAQITPTGSQDAILSWGPSITDTAPGGRRHDVDISVDDGRGGRSRQRLGVVVYPTFGTPTFDLPAGVVLNLANEDALDLMVAIKDDDSTSISLDLTEAPDGARLQMAEPKVGQFYWQPDEAQRRVAVHRAIFVARDESNATATHVLTIVLLNAEKQSGCAGQPPTIAHVPLPDTRTSGALTLTATATDGQSQVEGMNLQWTRGAPNGAYTSAFMPRASEGGDTFSTSIDLGSIPSSGALVHYFLVATDNDDPTGLSCDQSARLPKSGYFTAAVYPPGASASACADDDAEPDDSPGLAAPLGPGVHAGRRLCAPDSDLIALDADAGTTVVATLQWAASHGDLELALVDASGSLLGFGPELVPGTATLTYERTDERPIFLEVVGRTDGDHVSYSIELSIESARCEDDGHEPDSKPDEARPVGADTYKLCPGDSDFFAVPLGAGTPTRIALAFDHRYGDLDLELRAADGVTVLARSASEKSLEELTYTADSPTTGVVRVYGVDGATNAYTLTTSSSTEAVCPTDGLGANFTPEAAVLLLQDAYEGFTTCGGQPDWFAVDLNDSERLDLLVVTERGRANLRVYRDPVGLALADRAADAQGYADAQVTASGPERLYYEVYTTDTLPVTYALLQEVVDPPGPCRPDRYEPNSLGSPTAIELGIHTWLRLCGDGDTDVYAVTVPAFSNLVAFTDHAPGEHYSDLELRGPNGNTVLEETDLGEGAYLEQFLETGGTYLLIVKPFETGSGLGYDLAVFAD